MKNSATPTLRALDLALVLVTTPIWGPVMVATAAACLVGQGRPALFIQERAGLDGRPFRAYKFRTMIRNADTYLDSTGQPTAQRVTPIGAVLRRTGLDELPQLINVLRGDMSLVGPRPVLPEWLTMIPGGSAHPRFRVRPGISGPAQIAGRNTVLWSRRLDFDTLWAEHPSPYHYIRILARTPFALLRPTVSGDRNQNEVNDLGH